jgi:CBS-domain-containing membrane protein
MTDLRRMPPISVRIATPIDEALQGMIHSGVRFLFVVDDGERLVGAVTSYDIQGEKPLLYLQSLDCTLHTCSRADVQVRHLMEPVDEWPVLLLRRVARVPLRHVAAELETLGRRHLVVVDREPGASGGTVCGLFSATQIEREVGISIGGTRRADRFADIQRALAH